MPFELNPAIFDTYDKSFPMPDIEGAMDRRKRRELADRQLQQQADIAAQGRIERAREFNMRAADRQLQQQADIAAQGRIERAREFNMRAAEAGGQDLARSPEGEVDWATTARNREARMAHEAMLGEQGIQSVLNPRRVPDVVAGPWQGENPTVPPELPFTDEQKASAAFFTNRAKAAEEARKQAFELQKVIETSKARQGLAAANTQNREAYKYIKALQDNDPNFDVENFTIRDKDGNQTGLDIKGIMARHNEVMPRINLEKFAKSPGAWAVMSEEDKNRLGLTPEQQAQLNRNAEKSSVVRNTNAIIESTLAAAKASGEEVDPTEIEDMRRNLLESGGKLQPVPAAEAKIVSNLFGSLDAADILLEGVDQYEKKYGQGSFDKNLGFVPSKLNEIEAAFKGKNTQQEKDALDLLTRINKARNGKLLGRSGQAVTSQEDARLTREMGNVTDKNTLEKFRVMRQDEAKDLARQLRRLTDKDIPDYDRRWLRSEFGGKNLQVPSDVSQRTPAGGKKIGRFTVEVVE